PAPGGAAGAARAAAPPARQDPPPARPAPGPGPPASRTAGTTSVALRTGSAQCPGPCAITTCRGGPPGDAAGLRKPSCARDRPGPPAATITAGRWAPPNPGASSRERQGAQ